MSLKRRIYKILLSLVKKNNKRVSEKIPKYKLDQKHIKNARLLMDRNELLNVLPKEGIVAEIGVDEGKFTESIIKINKPKKIHLIDIWAGKRYNKTKKKKVFSKFESAIKDEKIEINLGLSTEVVNKFEDKYFDWIYIDTDHTYQTTIKELESWSHKVKEDGIIAGHDYIVGNWNSVVRYGVIEAVYEFCKKYDWEILYITSELNTSPSFAIKKLKIS